MPDALKPCPFCGEEPYSPPLGQWPSFRLVCPHCNMTGPDGASSELAIAAWNRRAHPPPEGGKQ